MEYGPLEKLISRRDFPRHSWNPKIHYLVYNSPPLNCDLNRVNPVQAHKSLFTIHFTPMLPKWSFNFSDKNLVSFLNFSLTRYGRV
jgi:hypothetical protein